MGLKFRFGFDDSLDVVGVHLVGGLVGTLLIGFFADPGQPGRRRRPVLRRRCRPAVAGRPSARVAVLVYSFVLTTIIALVVKATIGFRVTDEAEADGHRRGRARGDRVRLLDACAASAVLGTPRPDAADAARPPTHVPAHASKES